MPREREKCQLLTFDDSKVDSAPRWKAGQAVNGHKRVGSSQPAGAPERYGGGA